MPDEGAIHIGGQSVVFGLESGNPEWVPGTAPRRVTEMLFCENDSVFALGQRPRSILRF